MKLNAGSIKNNLKFQSFMGITILFLIYKVFIYSPDSWILLIFNGLLTALTIFSLIIYLIEFSRSRKINPLALVINVGILNAVLFFLFTYSDSILSGLYNISTGRINQNIFDNLVSFFYSFIILVSISVIFMVFRELYFLKKKKSVSLYFNTMLVFFVLASFGALLKDIPDLHYIRDTFFIISVVLITVNSLKISWIAFIVKKDKISLLALSIVISVLFVANLINGSGNKLSDKVVIQFSPVLSQFFKIIMTYGAFYFTILFFTTLFHIPTAEAFDRKAQEVSFLQYFSKLITQSMDFKELTESLTEISAKVCNAHAAWLVWKDGEEFKAIANKNIGFYDSNILTKFIFESKNPKISDQTFFLNLNRFSNKPQLSDNYIHIAVSPLKAHNELKGYLIAVKKDDFIFDDEDKDAMTTFSDYASLAIENSRLLEESIEKERLEKELDVAREIQRKILPSHNPKLEKLQISSVFIPAFEVGGDYYDFFELYPNKFGFVIADVSGKGISAAFIMAEIKGIFESLSKTMESPRNILIKANEILKRTLDRKNFVSAAYGLIDLAEDTLSIARAGHCPVILIRNNEAQQIRPSGIGLGLDYSENFNESLEEMNIKLENNDILVLYTDGITEAKNSALEDFGSKNFESVLLENSDEEADEISKEVMNKVALFSQDNSQHDDITLVILKWKQNLKNNGVKEWQNSAPQLNPQVT